MPITKTCARCRSEYIQRCHQRVGRHLRPAGRLPAGCRLRADPVPGVPGVFAGLPVPGVRRYLHQGAAGSPQAHWGARAVRGGRHRQPAFQARMFSKAWSRCTPSTTCPKMSTCSAYDELYRVLAPGEQRCGGQRLAREPPDEAAATRWCAWAIRLRNLSASLAGKGNRAARSAPKETGIAEKPHLPRARSSTGTTPPGCESEVGSRMPVEILVWRSVSVRFLRSLIHPWLGGRYWLRLLYRLEERYPQLVRREWAVSADCDQEKQGWNDRDEAWRHDGMDMTKLFWSPAEPGRLARSSSRSCCASTTLPS